jgi:DNA-binding response OmpR family regulator
MPPPPNILIVEDEPILADNIKELLGDSVPNIRVVANGESAVEMLKSFSPDAVVMDYLLPGMNGVETYAQMSRNSPTKIDCVIITAELEERVRGVATDHGIRSVLTKPFSFAELLDRLEPEPGKAANDPPSTADDLPSGLA